ncbi:MAG TPA: protein tyrosine phosphatase [Verrucomicrobiales bacterium]|nr:protein tyrosine phosphatase [Verrucomicrobiales bacterium]
MNEFDQSARLRLLFVCSRNQWRSPTGEQFYRTDPRVEVRSAGVSTSAKRRLNAADLAWADLVLVMERSHRSRIIEQFRDADSLPPIESLDIPDDYQFMDPELVELIRGAVEPLLAKRQGESVDDPAP